LWIAETELGFDSTLASFSTVSVAATIRADVPTVTGARSVEQLGAP
jgi:hypothetical protein